MKLQLILNTSLYCYYREDIDEVEGLFRVQTGMETLVMFAEDMHKPVATLSVSRTLITDGGTCGS